jgi:predicted secreted protein
MTLAQALLSFVVIWAICMFLTLPFGVRPDQDLNPLAAPGAPGNVRFRWRIIAAAFLALLFTTILYFAIEGHWVPLEE